MDEVLKNTISADDIIKYAGSDESSVVVCGDIEVVVRHSISMRDYAEIVENVCAACFDENGLYRPYVRDYMYFVEFLKKFTNIDMPDDFEKCLAVVDVFTSHCNGAGDTWMYCIRAAADDNDIDLTRDIMSRIKFELDKYERETHERIGGILSMLRSLYLLADEAVGGMLETDEEEADSDDDDDVLVDDDVDDVVVEGPAI